MIIYLFTAIGLSPGGSGYFTCKQNMKLVTAKFKSGGLHEKHAADHLDGSGVTMWRELCHGFRVESFSESVT